MSREFTKTLEVVSQPEFPDAWWVSVNGETISVPQTLEQAKAQKPPRSRAKVLILHTSLSDEWIPIRDLENLVKRHAYDPEKAKRLEEEAEEENQRIAEELEEFQKDLPSELQTMRESRGLLNDPSPEQMQRVLAEFERVAREDGWGEHEEILMKACPECFDPAALQNPDLYEEALDMLDFFGILDNPCYDMRLLYSSDSRDLCFDDVLLAPTVGQLVAVLKTFKNGWESRSESCDDECPGNRKLAKRIAKLFPELVKDTPEAQQFFNPQPKGERKTPSSKPKPFIRQSKKADGKKETTITIGPVTILVLVLVIVFLVSRCL